MTLRAVLVISLGGVQSAITATRPVEGFPVAKGIVEMTLRAVLVISLGTRLVPMCPVSPVEGILNFPGVGEMTLRRKMVISRGGVYNEPIHRGYAVDVGVVEHRVMKDGKSEYKQYEMDFIASDGNEKYYIQSAYDIPDDAKRNQELNSLLRINDSFQKIVIVKDDIMPYRDNHGIYFIGLFQFLKGNSLT